MSFTRLSLKNSVTPGNLSHLAWDLDWDIYDIIKGDETRPFEKIWLANSGQTTIHYLEDRLIGVRYLLLEGKAQPETASQIREAIAVYAEADITAMFDQARGPKSLIRALRQMGAASQPAIVIPAWCQRIEKAARHESPDVRYAAVLALAYTGWRTLRPLLEELAADDPDPDVQKTAAAALTALKKHS